MTSLSSSPARPLLLSCSLAALAFAASHAATFAAEPVPDIEYLEVEVSMDQRENGRIQEYYTWVLQVNTEKGVEQMRHHAIPGYNDRIQSTAVTRVQGRVVHPDGSVVELDGDHLFEGDLLRDGIESVAAKTVAFPGMRVGSKIELSYKVSENLRSGYIRTYGSVPLFLPHPVRKYTFKIIPHSRAKCRYSLFNADAEIVQEGMNQARVELTDVPAMREEPYMPSLLDVGSWFAYEYDVERFTWSPKSHWRSRAKDLYKYTRKHVDGKNGKVRELAAELFKGAEGEEAKLKAAYDYCAKRIRNVDMGHRRFARAELEGRKPARNPGETIERGHGTREEINALFASLAEAAGFDARFTAFEDRNEFHFGKGVLGRIGLPDSHVVAVRPSEDSDEWSFCDPGAPYLPFGFLNLGNTLATALIADPRKPVFAKSKLPPPEASQLRREGSFKLAANGDLEGEATFVFTGYEALGLRRSLERLDQADEPAYFKRQFLEHVPNLALENLDIQGRVGWDEPLTATFALEIPDYADAVGSRLFFNPNVFDYGRPPKFEADSRQHMVIFKRLHSMEDEIWIELPEGYAIEAGSAPGRPIDQGVVRYRAGLAATESGDRVRYACEYARSAIAFPAKYYSQVKAIYDEIHRQDNHSLAAKKLKDIAAN